jgi:hypothetical protein
VQGTDDDPGERVLLYGWLVPPSFVREAEELVEFPGGLTCQRVFRGTADIGDRHFVGLVRLDDRRRPVLYKLDISGRFSLDGRSFDTIEDFIGAVFVPVPLTGEPIDLDDVAEQMLRRKLVFEELEHPYDRGLALHGGTAAAPSEGLGRRLGRGDRVDAARQIGERVRTAVTSDRRRTVTHGDLVRAAEAYRETGGVMTDVRDRLKTSLRTAYRRVERARELGLLEEDE